MANNYAKILELANKNNMGLSNTIKRDYGIPLDYSSVQESYEAALNYAKTSTLAYLGQPISVGDTLYIVTDEANGYLKAVGIRPEGDLNSIEISENGEVSVKGFATAGNAQLPRVKVITNENEEEIGRTIEWVPVESIFQRDGNTKAVVQVAEDSAITVTKTRNEETDTDIFTLDVTLPEIPEVPEYTITKAVDETAGTVTYQLTRDNVAVGEAVVVSNAYDDTALAGRVAAVEADVEDHESRLAGIELFFEAADKDSGSEEAGNLHQALDTLKEIQDYITSDGVAANEMLTAIGNNTTAINTLTGSGDGSVSKAISDAVSAHATTAAGTYATLAAVAEIKATADAAAVKTEVNAALANKADASALADYRTVTDSYSKDDIDRIVAGIQGEYGETADSVAAALETHAAANAASFSAVETKQGQQDTAIQANADQIAAMLNETSGIKAQALAEAAVTAQSKVDALAAGAVATNTGDISAINTKIEGINSNIAAISGNVGALEQKDINLEAAINAEVEARGVLSETVAGHTTDITGLKDKDTALAALISANTAKFDNYSTTAEVETKIAAAVNAIDTTAITTAIEANATAISTEKSRAEAEELRIAGLVTTNTTAIQKNTADIAKLDTALQAVIDDKDGTTLNSIKDLADWVKNHDGENGVLATVTANKAALDILNGAATVEGSVAKTVADAIAAIPATPVATAQTAGIVKASAEVNVAQDGTMGIGVISTDKLIAGTQTWVLNGGSATAPQV